MIYSLYDMNNGEFLETWDTDEDFKQLIEGDIIALQNETMWIVDSVGVFPSRIEVYLKPYFMI